MLHMLFKIMIAYKYIEQNLLNRPPKSSIKPQSPVLTDDEEEEDQELIEAKIVLRDVSTAGKFISCDLSFKIYYLFHKFLLCKCKF